LCFNPALAFDSLKKMRPRSIILTSGTLAPLDSFEKELKVMFSVKEEIEHLINKDQVSLHTLSFGIDL
jgi:Rad3-related DNA helicase